LANLIRLTWTKGNIQMTEKDSSGLENGVNLPHDRMMVCLEAAWEIDALARLLPEVVPRDEDGAHLVARGIAGRMLRLTSALMSGLGEQTVKTDALDGIVYVRGAGQG
jgi:hypothetical protein